MYVKVGKKCTIRPSGPYVGKLMSVNAADQVNSVHFKCTCIQDIENFLPDMLRSKGWGGQQLCMCQQGLAMEGEPESRGFEGFKTLGTHARVCALDVLRMHLPDSLSQRIEAGHLAFINENRVCTVLFIGFPSIKASLHPVHVLQHLDPSHVSNCMHDAQENKRLEITFQMLMPSCIMCRGPRQATMTLSRVSKQQ